MSAALEEVALVARQVNLARAMGKLDPGVLDEVRGLVAGSASGTGRE